MDKVTMICNLPEGCVSNHEVRVYWGLIVWDHNRGAFHWAYGSHDRIDVVKERWDYMEHGFKPSGMFVHRFMSVPHQHDIDRLISLINRLDSIIA